MKRSNLNKNLLFKIALESISMGVVILNPHSRIIFINETAKKILALEQESPPYYLSRINLKAWKEIKEIFTTGQPQVGKRTQRQGPPLFVQRYPLRYEGEIFGVISLFQQFSEMEKLSPQMESYQKIVKQLNTIIESIYDGLYITDGRGITIRVNSSWERITGLKPEDVLGKDTAELEKKGYISKFVTPIILKEKTPISIQAKTVTNREVLVTGNPVLGKDGKVEMVVTTVRDLSEMRRLSRELNEAKRLVRHYKNKMEKLKRQLTSPREVVIESKVMKEIVELCSQVASTSAPVLITGETGVGKEIIAHLIHDRSPSSKGPFLKINCSTIPENLLEAELFGYEKGAFTGANNHGKPGLFEIANKGTLVLDEIGELPLSLQAKLLTVLQDYEIKRLGGLKKRKIEVRFICLTNKNLKEMVKKGSFREDLYFRINVIPIHIPPLRERKEDIVPLIHFFLQRFNQKYGKHKSIHHEVVDTLLSYNWPGNVRELKNLIERLVIMSKENTISLSDLPRDIRESIFNFSMKESLSLKELVQHFEAQIIHNTIKQLGSVEAAALRLKVNPSTLYRKMQKCKNVLQKCN